MLNTIMNTMPLNKTTSYDNSSSAYQELFPSIAPGYAPEPVELCDVCGYPGPCSRETSLYEFVLQGVLMLSINILGIICNTISIYILSRKQMRASINCCLIGLATFDILLLVCSMLVWGIPAVTQYSPRLRTLSNQVIPHMTPWLYPLATIARTGSTYVTVTITVERYVAVCHSLKARYICTYGRARLYMIFISVFVLLYNVPKFLETEARPVVKLPENETVVRYIACATELRNNLTYIEIYIMWMYLIVMYCIPFVTLVVLNALIYQNVCVANRMRQLLSRRQETEIGLASMLFAIVLLFMVCNSLSFVINIMELSNNSHTSLIGDTGLNHLTDCSNLLINISSSSNFIIYCIFGQKFRRLFLRLFCGRLFYRHCRTWNGAADDVTMLGGGAAIGSHRASLPMARLGRIINHQHDLPQEGSQLLSPMPTQYKSSSSGSPFPSSRTENTTVSGV